MVKDDVIFADRDCDVVTTDSKVEETGRDSKLWQSIISADRKCKVWERMTASPLTGIPR
jgi:hypothetical protein